MIVAQICCFVNRFGLLVHVSFNLLFASPRLGFWERPLIIIDSGDVVKTNSGASWPLSCLFCWLGLVDSDRKTRPCAVSLGLCLCCCQLFAGMLVCWSNEANESMPPLLPVVNAFLQSALFSLPYLWQIRPCCLVKEDEILLISGRNALCQPAFYKENRCAKIGLCAQLINSPLAKDLFPTNQLGWKKPVIC